MYGLLLFLHLLGATIWTGGHLVLAFVVLPRALRERSVGRLLEFESGYEKIGMPALLLQIVTGSLLAHRIKPDIAGWLDTEDPVSRLIMAKLVLLLLTAALAIHARVRVLPVLTADRLVVMAWHIVPVTGIAVLYLIVGLSFRTGWWPASL